VEIALDLLGGRLSHAEICRKHGISSTYAYKLKDRALEILRQGINRPVGRPNAETQQLQKRVTDLEQLVGDQALVIRSFKNEELRLAIGQVRDVRRRVTFVLSGHVVLRFLPDRDAAYNDL